MLIKTMPVAAVDNVRYATVQQNESATGKNAQSETWLHEHCTTFFKICIDCGSNNRSKNLEIRTKCTKN